MHVSIPNNQFLSYQRRSSTKDNISSSNNSDNFITDNSKAINSTTKQQPITDFSFLTASDLDLVQRATGVTIKDGYIRDSDGNRLGFIESHGSPLDPTPTQTKAAFDLAETLADMRMNGGIQGDTSLQNGRKITTDDLEAYLNGYAAAKTSGQSNVYAPDADAIKQAEQILTYQQG